MKAMLFILALLAFFAGSLYYVVTKPSKPSYYEERRGRIETDIEEYLTDNEDVDNYDKAKAILRLVDED